MRRAERQPFRDAGERVRVRDAVSPPLELVRDAGDEVLAVEAIAAPGEREEPARSEGADAGRAGDLERRRRLGLHPQRCGARRGREELLQLRRLLAAARGDPVEALGIAAGVVVDLEAVARGGPQRHGVTLPAATDSCSSAEPSRLLPGSSKL